jgi:hypothetical protein
LYPDTILPEAALYFEIDYFSKETGKIISDDLINLIKSNIARSVNIFKQFKDYVLD